jgi:hypothetical protein
VSWAVVGIATIPNFEAYVSENHRGWKKKKIGGSEGVIVLSVSISASLYELLTVYRHHCFCNISLIEIRRKGHARCRHRLLTPSGVGFSSLFLNEADKSLPPSKNRAGKGVLNLVLHFCCVCVFHECVILHLILLNVIYKDFVRCDCLCGLVVRVPDYRSRDLSSIFGATRLSEK